MCINSAANFIIYYLNGTKFRQAWCEIYGYVPRFILSVLCMSQCVGFRNDNRCNSSMYFKAPWSKLIVQAKKIASGASLNIKLQKTWSGLPLNLMSYHMGNTRSNFYDISHVKVALIVHNC